MQSHKNNGDLKMNTELNELLDKLNIEEVRAYIEAGFIDYEKYYEEHPEATHQEIKEELNNSLECSLDEFGLLSYGNLKEELIATKRGEWINLYDESLKQLRISFIKILSKKASVSYKIKYEYASCAFQYCIYEKEGTDFKFIGFENTLRAAKERLDKYIKDKSLKEKTYIFDKNGERLNE